VALLTFKVRSTSTVVPPSRNPESTSTCDRLPVTLCQPFTTTFAKRAFRCSAPAVWYSLPKSVLNSDSVAVFKSRLKTTLFSGFLFFLCSITRCLAPAPLKLRPYGAIQIITRCSAIAERPRCRVRYSFPQK